MKNTKRTWRHSYERLGSWQVSHAISMLIKGLRATKLKYVPKQGRCKEVAGFNASFPLHLHKRDVGVAPFQGRRPDVVFPSSVSMWDKQIEIQDLQAQWQHERQALQEQKRGKAWEGQRSRACAVASCMCSDTTGYSRCSLKRVFIQLALPLRIT